MFLFKVIPFLKIAMFGMMAEGDFDFSSILGGGNEEETPGEQPAEGDENAPSGEESKKENPKALEKKYANLEKSYKNQQEYIRQLQEKQNKADDRWNKLLGLDEDQKKGAIELELRKKFDEDPLSVINDLVNQRVSEINSTIEKERTVNRVDSVMADIDKEYIVDWDKDFVKIKPHLDYFSDKAKREKPKEVLLSACRMAGVLKTREDGDFNYVQSSKSNGAIKKSEMVKIEKSIKDSMKSKAPKNIFGI